MINALLVLDIEDMLRACRLLSHLYRPKAMRNGTADIRSERFISIHLLIIRTSNASWGPSLRPPAAPLGSGRVEGLLLHSKTILWLIH